MKIAKIARRAQKQLLEKSDVPTTKSGHPNQKPTEPKTSDECYGKVKTSLRVADF